jgi:hypothetical protein
MNESIFDGDGRVKVRPVNAPGGTQPISITRAKARTIIRMFEMAGFSTHSRAGNLVWVIVTHCLEQRIEYRLRKHYGWVAEKNP